MGIDHIFQYPLLIVIVRGLSTHEEIIGVFNEIALDPRIESSETIILDMRYADFTPSPKELKRIADHLASVGILCSKRWAIAVQPISVMFGNVRIFCVFMKSNGLIVELFPVFSKAVSWALLS